MKKLTIFVIVFIFALFTFISCEMTSTAPGAGKAKADNMLRLLPKDVLAIFFINFNKAINLEIVDNLIKKNIDSEFFKKLTDYQEFMNKTGIDLQKDVYFIAGAITGELEEDKQEGVGIINLKYEKDSLLAFIKETSEEGTEFTEEDYNEFTIYNYKEKDEEGSFVFLNDSNIAIGNKENVKSVINISQKKEESILKDEAFSALFAKTNKKALFWIGAVIPPETMSEIKGEAQMLSMFESVNAVSIYFDYQNVNVITEIKLMSSDEVKNQEMADSLNQYKAMGAMIQVQDLNMAELLDKIEITSGPDHVKVYASIPEELPKILIEKLTTGKPEEDKEKIK